jgi:hypothetical protein
MRTIIALLLLTSTCYAQTINNATVNMTGNMQNVIINQSGAGHSVNLNLIGNSIPVTVNQAGLTPQSFSLSVTCYSNCDSNPTVVNQY